MPRGPDVHVVMHCERNPEFSKRDSVDLSQPLQCQKDGVRIRISHGDRLTVLRPLAPPESQANEIQCKLSPGSSPQAGDFRCLDQPRVHAGATRVTDPSVGRQALPATATLPKRSSLREEVIVHDRRASSGTKPRVPSLPITGKAFAHGERAVSIGMNMMSREARKYCHYPTPACGIPATIGDLRVGGPPCCPLHQCRACRRPELNRGRRSEVPECVRRTAAAYRQPDSNRQPSFER